LPLIDPHQLHRPQLPCSSSHSTCRVAAPRSSTTCARPDLYHSRPGTTAAAAAACCCLRCPAACCCAPGGSVCLLDPLIDGLVTGQPALLPRHLRNTNTWQPTQASGLLRVIHTRVCSVLKWFSLVWAMPLLLL
jgi:hypothetical protein